MLYKLTKKTESTICHNEKEIKIAEKAGYVLDGEVDKDFNVINPNPVFKAPVKRKK